MQVLGAQSLTFTSDLVKAQSNNQTSFSNVLSSVTESIAKSDPNSDNKMDTNQGHIEFNLDEYFSGERKPGPVNLDEIPLLLPTEHNINRLAAYSEKKFNALLEQYDIPAPPKTIEFDQEGNLVLPKDYSYAEQLKQALRDNPEVEKALHTTTALASHYAGIMEAQPYRDEMSTARNQADRDRIIAKYSYLFDDNRPPKQIILNFLEDGSLLLGENPRPK